mgnify:FL=1
MKLLFSAFVFLHGLLHLVGFIKAYFSPELLSDIVNIPKPMGLLWLLTTVLFLHMSSVLYKSKNKDWVYLAFVTVCLSQFLIYSSWKDAKFGTLFNVIVFLVAILEAADKMPYKIKYVERK